ncbi:MAG TPA: hypothetical protein VHY32_03715 [Caulobacteraceae bacterium]|jgi:hypothetical protein|nr:hypothetical protein [Caulobacteraceae bacterium]
MDDEAYAALEAVARSGDGDLSAHQRWIKAFKAIRWIVRTEAGLALTAAGRQARDEMAARRQSENHADDWRGEAAPGK